MMKVRKLLTSAFMIRVYGPLALFGIFFNAPPALAYCPPPPGVTTPEEPGVTAQQVEDGSASLKDFALASRERFVMQIQTAENLGQVVYYGCLFRQEGSYWHSGSTYLVILRADGSILIHAKNMALASRRLNPLIYAEILSALGAPSTVLGNLASPDSAVAAQAGADVFDMLSQGPDAEFDATTPTPGLRPGIPGASGYAAAYWSDFFRGPLVMVAGFELDETHLIEEEIDHITPAVSARDVVDRETLKAFVTEAGEYCLELRKTGNFPGGIARIALRDPNGPWRHGSVYLYVLDTTSNIIQIHAAFPNRYELRPLIATVRDAVTGELILPQVIEAAKSDPEGGFVEYYFDDPNDDTDSADIPKVGYAREFKTKTELGGRVVPYNFIIGSGFYGRAAEVATGPSTVVEASVLGDAVEGLDVAFSRAIAGRQSDYAWSTVTDAAGLLSLTIASADGVSGYYRARATNVDGEVVGQWSSIPLNEGHRQTLELTLGGGARIVRVRELAAAEPVAASKPVFEAEAVPEASGLSPNSPNPFNSATLITYQLSSPGPVKLVIYNVLGQPVRTLVDETRGAGTYHVRWDARDDGGALLSTGVYIAHLNYPGGAQNQRLLYLK